MRPDHATLRERVLAYEELDPAERAEADAHLQSCASCRELLHALQSRESLARTEGRLPPGPVSLAVEDATDERASVERLLRKLSPPVGAATPRPAERAEPSAARPRPARSRIPPWAWAVPAAAAALAIVFWGGPGREPIGAPRLESLAVEHASAMRGSSDQDFHTGDAFSIRFQLTAAARPIVVAVGDSGAAEVLYPAGGSPARLFAPGIVVLPDMSAGEAWTFAGPPGRETFLAGSLRGAAADLGFLRSELARATATAADRAGRVRAARVVLEKHADSVGEITVSHTAPTAR